MENDKIFSDCIWVSVCDSSFNKLHVMTTVEALSKQNYLFFRDAVWTNADQSWISLSPFKVPVQCEQENSNSHFV